MKATRRNHTYSAQKKAEPDFFSSSSIFFLSGCESCWSGKKVLSRRSSRRWREREKKSFLLSSKIHVFSGKKEEKMVSAGDCSRFLFSLLLVCSFLEGKKKLFFSLEAFYSWPLWKEGRKEKKQYWNNNLSNYDLFWKVLKKLFPWRHKFPCPNLVYSFGKELLVKAA